MKKSVCYFVSAFVLISVPALADDAAVIAKMDALTARIAELEGKLTSTNSQPLKFSVIERPFSNLIGGGAQIPDSEGAIFCGLTFVDDDAPHASCEVTKGAGNIWLYNTGGDGTVNACKVTCLFAK
jgi:hypothetical protein